MPSFQESISTHNAIGLYYQAKCELHFAYLCLSSWKLTWLVFCTDEADVDLHKRSRFPWTILRPSSLHNGASKGVSLAERGTITIPVSRESVAKVLLALAELPHNTKGCNGQAWNLTDGRGEIHQQVEKAVQQKRSDWVD